MVDKLLYRKLKTEQNNNYIKKRVNSYFPEG